MNPGTVATIVIGRNEGERLKRCLQSVLLQTGTVVYVDSGSTDGSSEYAASVGCHVVALDMSRPFSAARARNEGAAKVFDTTPDTAYLQFLDGDCELAPGWLDAGATAFAEHPAYAIVSGHLRELYPSATVYNKLCDLEWQRVPGEIDSTGGIFMVRAASFRTIEGFRPEVIAAEDNEFCVRMRGTGGRIVQIDAEMAKHDAAMTSFAQWWQRARRTGHAYGQVASIHKSQHYFAADRRRVWMWGLAIPLLALLFAPFTYGITIFLLLAAYALQFLKIYQYGRRRGWNQRDARVYAFFTVLFKFPALTGLFEYHWRQWRGRGFTIIEHKRS